MATKEEWKEFFEFTEGRKPTIAEYEAAIADGSIANSSVSADKSNTTSGLADKKKSKKWVLALVGILVVLGIGAGVFGYVNYQSQNQVNQTNISKKLNILGYNRSIKFDDFTGDAEASFGGADGFQCRAGDYSIFLPTVSDQKARNLAGITVVIGGIVSYTNSNTSEKFLIIKSDNQTVNLSKMTNGQLKLTLNSGEWAILFENNSGSSINSNGSGKLTSLSQIPPAK